MVTNLNTFCTSCSLRKLVLLWGSQSNVAIEVFSKVFLFLMRVYIILADYVYLCF